MAEASEPEVKYTQWFAYWEGVHQAVKFWATGAPMSNPYPTPRQVEEQLAKWQEAE